MCFLNEDIMLLLIGSCLGLFVLIMSGKYCLNCRVMKPGHDENVFCAH